MSPQPSSVRGISTTTPLEEARLDWYREDPLANDHHAHWHYVYPRNGVPTPSGPKTQPRQGELFFYMHQQMMARYDTERKIAGLEPCKPLDDYRGPIAEGYELDEYEPRPAGHKPRNAQILSNLDEGQAEAAAMLAKKEIEIVNGGGEPVGSAPLDENVLGAEIESSDWYATSSDSQRTELHYLNFHGSGHGAIASASQPSASARFPGPMSYVETAIRDPAFYRWHGHIDGFYAEYQEPLPANDLSAFAAEVAFRKPEGSANTGDIAVCHVSDIPGSENPDFDFEAWGLRELGVDLDKGGPVKEELLTGFARSDVALAEPSPLIPTEWLRGVIHLTHEPFVFFIRVDSKKTTAHDVAVRIFLAHVELAEDRRRWIELDKFKATLDPGANLIARPDARSSVVKRKGLSVPGAEAHAGTSMDVWCDCGWPYGLLLPSGESTAEGTPFKLMVAVTDWEKDHVGEPDTCGSMSFCGARNEYPDKRQMGYPFDRKFDSSIESAVAANPSMGMRDLRIRCTTQRPPGA
jgi:hypothetical protein